MSTNNEYSMTIKLKDEDLKKSLEKISKAGEDLVKPLEETAKKFQAFESRKSKYTDKSWIDEIRNKIDDIGLGDKIEDIDKSTVGILAGVTSIVALITTIVASSEYLQKMFELIQTAVMLIFRPIGDFIAAFLKPIIMYFYRYFIIPYVKQVLPIMIQLGDWLGNNAMKNLKSNIDGWESIIKAIEDALSPQEAHADDGLNLGNDAKEKNFNEQIDEFFKWIEDSFAYINSELQKAWDSFIDWLTPHFNNIKSKLDKYWNAAVNWFLNVSEDIKDTLQTAWNATINWFLNVSEDIKQTLQTAWNATVNWFLNVSDNIKKTLTNAWNATVSWFQGIAKSAQTTLTNAWNALVGTVQDIARKVGPALVEGWNYVLKALNNVAQSANSTLIQIWNNIVTAFHGIMESAGSTLIQIWNGIVTVFGGIAQSAGSTLTTIWNNITTVFAGIHKSLSDALIPAWKTIVGYFAGIAKSAIDALAPAWGKIVGITELIGERIESGAKAFVKTLQSGIDIMAKSFGGMFDGLIKAFNNWVKQINNASGGVDSARDERDSERDPSPDTGEDPKGPTGSTGGQGEGRERDESDDSDDTGGRPDSSHTIIDNTKQGWYLYKGTKYLGVIITKHISTGSSPPFWAYKDDNGIIHYTKTTAGYTARKNRLSDGYDSKPPPDITDPNNDDTDGDDPKPPYDTNPPPDIINPDKDDSGGGSGSTVKKYTTYAGWYLYKGNTYMGVIRFSQTNSKTGKSWWNYTDVNGIIRVTQSTNGYTPHKTKKVPYDSKPPPDTQDPNNEDTEDDSGEDDDSGGSKPSGSKPKPKKPSHWTDEFYESVYGFPPPDDSSSSKSMSSSPVSSSSSSNQFQQKSLSLLTKISTSLSSIDKKKNEVKVTVNGDGSNVETKIQEDVRRSGL